MRAIASMSFDESIAYTESQIALTAMCDAENFSGAREIAAFKNSHEVFELTQIHCVRSVAQGLVAHGVDTIFGLPGA